MWWSGRVQSVFTAFECILNILYKLGKIMNGWCLNPPAASNKSSLFHLRREKKSRHVCRWFLIIRFLCLVRIEEKNKGCLQAGAVSQQTPALTLSETTVCISYTPGTTRTSNRSSPRARLWGNEIDRRRESVHWLVRRHRFIHLRNGLLTQAQRPGGPRQERQRQSPVSSPLHKAGVNSRSH